MARSIKICPYCGQQFLAKTYRAVTCDNIECKRAHERDIYKQTVYKHICTECGTIFENHAKTMDKELCLDCKRKQRVYQKVEVKTVCRQCGIVLKTELKNNTRPNEQHIVYVTCDACKQKNYQESSERMKLNNPSYFGNNLTQEEYKEKKAIEEAERLYHQEHNEELIAEFAKCVSVRMKSDNPMKRPEVVEKMKRTIASKIATGQLVYKKGPERKGWRGTNSPVRDAIRSQLQNWRKAQLADANYTCQLCGANHCELHVHHKERFFDIVNKCAEQLGIDINNIKRCDEITLQFTPEYAALEKLVLEYHNTHDVGIVVCVHCHDKIDPQFRKPIKLRKVENIENNQQKNDSKDL